MKTLLLSLSLLYSSLRYTFHVFLVKRDRARLFYYMRIMGVEALGLVLVIGFFTGSIMAWQAAYQMKDLMNFSQVGGQMARIIVMEIGPVLTALILAGRVGASLTAEIASMKITEQLDALRTMNISIARFILIPRVIGLMIMVPTLTVFSDLTGILGSLLILKSFLKISLYTFIDSIKTYFKPTDLWLGLLKTFFFGIIIATIGVHEGLHASHGAEGVGKATIRSFVRITFTLLTVDFLLWFLLF